MYLLPYQRKTIKSKLDADDIRLRLAKYVQGVTWGLGELDAAPYSGWIGEDRFEINGARRYRSPFAPLIAGTLHPVVGEEGTQLRLAMHLPSPIPGVLLGWIGLCGMSLGLAWLLGLSQAYGLLFLLSIIGVGIPLTAFTSECFRDEQWLRRLVIDPPPRRMEDYLPYNYTPPAPAPAPSPDPQPTQALPRPWFGGPQAPQRYAGSPRDWVPDHEAD
jgi:hypothetical protein